MSKNSKHPLSIRNTTLYTTTLASALLLQAAAGQAQQVTQLPEIVVEASQLGGVEAKAQTSGSAFSVLTSQQIKERQYRHSGDALRAIPGVHIGTTGGAGGLTQLRLRGSEANNTKVLIDGISVNAPSDGGFDFSTLLAADIERIEVLRGPQSGIYGGNALAGVVNIITKKGGGKPSVSATAEAGSRDTRAFSGNVSTSGDHGYVSLSGAYRETDGFNIASVGNEEDGSRQGTIFARAGIEFTPQFRIDGMLRHQNNKANGDGNGFGAGSDVVTDLRGSTTDRSQNMGHLTASLNLFEGAWLQKFHGEFLSDDTGFASPTFSSDSTGTRNKFSYLSQFKFDGNGINHTLSGLIDHTEEDFISTSTFSTTALNKRTQTGYVAQYRLDVMDEFFLNGNLRYDDNDKFKDATTYKIGASYRLPWIDTRFHGSYGKGIKDPTMFELFGFSTNFIPNPNLKPEESIGWDVGIEQGFFNHQFVIDATYFKADLTDKIGTTGFPSTPINLTGTSKNQGIEVSLAAHPTDNLSLVASYTYTDSRDPDGVLAVRRPFHAASANITYLFAEQKGKVNLELIYKGESDDSDFRTFPSTRVSVGDSTLVNLSTSYQLTDNIELFSRAENLLDEDYRDVFGYRSTPLSIFGGVRIKLSE